MIPSVNLLLLSNPSPISIFAPELFFSVSPSPYSAGVRGPRCRCRRDGGGAPWDANAESARAGRFRSQDGGKEEKRRWWSEDEDVESAGEDGFDPFDGYDDDPQPWDVIWIFKVFRSYGYLLPAIIASMDLATGPKAFLMALALPLGQSAISLAVEKLWGKDTEEPQRKPRNKNKPFANYTRDYNKQWTEENIYDDDGKPGYQSWASLDGGVAGKGNNASSPGPSLGGWDELDTRGGGVKSSTRRQPNARKGPVKSETRKKGRLFKRGKHKDTPLFLRLLIAVFPFLASWTRIL